MNPYGEEREYHHQQALNSLGGSDGVGSAAPPTSGQGSHIQREGPGILDEEFSIGSRFSIGSDDDRTAYSRVSRFSPKRLTRAFRHSFGVWDKLSGKGRTRISWFNSAKAIITYSWINGFLLFLPFAWALHFGQDKADISHAVVFGLCFVTLIPLSKLLEYGGEQLALYCGPLLGDLIAVTLSNAVEATLALFLLAHCELKLLQSTITGVILLRLLLIPGTSFITGGVHVEAQELHPLLTQLNHTLLTIATLALLLPAAYFAALDKGNYSDAILNPETVVSDDVRGQFLKVSRGLAVILLIVYICSRFFLHTAPGEDKELHKRKDAPSGYVEKVRHLQEEEPEANPWACMLMLLIAVPLMAFTMQFLVESIEPMRKKLGLQEEWFGLILLPIVSFSADGLLSSVYYIRHLLKKYLPNSSYLSEPYNPNTLAEARAIDLSIQFAIFWLPLFVLIGWGTGKPFSLLFDMFEVALLLGACFLVNYVTADAKTNWAEGAMMVAFYIMIALTAWFYPGQAEVHAMLSCDGVASAVALHVDHLAHSIQPQNDHNSAQSLHGDGDIPQSEGEPVEDGENEGDKENSERGRGGSRSNSKYRGGVGNGRKGKENKQEGMDEDDDDEDDGGSIELGEDGQIILNVKDAGELADTLRLLAKLYRIV